MGKNRHQQEHHQTHEDQSCAGYRHSIQVQIPVIPPPVLPLPITGLVAKPDRVVLPAPPSKGTMCLMIVKNILKKEYFRMFALRRGGKK